MSCRTSASWASHVAEFWGHNFCKRAHFLRLKPRSMVELLLERGANANLRSAGVLPLTRAVGKARPDAVKLLLEHGADVALMDRVRNFNAVMVAALFCGTGARV